MFLRPRSHRHLYDILLGLILFCFFASAHANFDLKQSNKAFDKISLKLATQNLDKTDISHAIEELELLQNKAKACLEQSKIEMEKLNTLQQAVQATDPTTTTSSTSTPSELQYVSKKREAISSQEADCKLFVFRMEEAINAYEQTLKKLTSKALFHASLPIWNTVNDIYNHNNGDISIDLHFISLERLSAKFKNSPNGFFIFSAVILAILGLYLCYLLGQISSQNKKLALLFASFKNYVLPLMLIIGATTYLQLYATEESDAIYLRVGLYLIALLLGLAGLRWLTEFLKLNENFLPIAKKLQRRSFYLFIYAFIFFSMEIVIDDITSSSHLKNIILYAGSMAFLMFYELWLNVLSKLFLTKNTFYATLIRAYQIMLGLLVLSSSSLGYYFVAAYIIGAIFSSTICLYVFTLFWQLTNSLYDTFNDPELPTGKKVRELLSIENDKNFIELLFLKVIIQLLLFGLLYVSITSTWSVSTHFLDLIEDTLFYNIKFGSFSFSLIRIIIGFSVFSGILLLGRLIASVAIEKKKHAKSDDTQIVLSSVIVYLAFALAVLVGLIAMGVDFTGLAIMAGALSVGVGLGLQNIVNNFVSGLILLIEQPIKPGDRVVVGNTEGIVKKIRIRSTQIKTMAKEDVIVPNAELIAHQITNYMYRDRNYRIVCKVGVAYGSDTELVSKLLFDVGINHPDVLTNPSNTPRVLFREFGDNSLLFELWCTIKDVNGKYTVHSELNFAIDKIFREHQIEIAFPQIDIHLKEMPVRQSTKNTTKPK